VEGPIDVEVVTDAADPGGSMVRSSEGTACTSVQDNSAWTAACWVLLDAGRPYIVHLHQRDGVADVQALLQLDQAGFDAPLLTPGTEASGTVPAHGVAYYATWLEPGAGYLIDGSSDQGAGIGIRSIDSGARPADCDGFCWNERSTPTSPGWTAGLAIAANGAPPFLVERITNPTDQPADFSLVVLETGAGTAVETPFALATIEGLHQEGSLPANGVHAYSVTATATESRSIELWSAGKVRWTLTGPDSEVRCTPVESTSPQGGWQAICDAGLVQDTTYTIAIAEQEGVDGVRHGFEGL